MLRRAHTGFNNIQFYHNQNLASKVSFVVCILLWSCFWKICLTFAWAVFRFEDVDLTTILPILWHGDDADSHRRRSFCCCTISSPLAAAGNVWDNRILVYCMDNSRACGETFQTLDAWMAWSLCELQHGQFFNVNPYGEQFPRGKTGRICGKYTAVLCAIKGDQKYLQRCLRLKTAWNSDQICTFCRATSKGDMIYTMFGPCAPHRQTLVSTEEFIESRCHMNPWIRIPGFDMQLVLADWLHVVDLAITPEVSASVFWFWIAQKVSIVYDFGNGIGCELKATFFFISPGCPCRHLLSWQKPIWFGKLTVKMNVFG